MTEAKTCQPDETERKHVLAARPANHRLETVTIDLPPVQKTVARHDQVKDLQQSLGVELDLKENKKVERG